MHSFLGHLFVAVALAGSCAAAVLGFWAGRYAHRNDLAPNPHSQAPAALAMVFAHRALLLAAAAMLAANATMVRALLARDFSVSYVAQVGSHAVPDWVAMVSLWSSLEGSILFWCAILGLYLAVFVWRMRSEPPRYMGYTLGVLGLMAAFFVGVVATVADPFAVAIPAPTSGPGPNPLLQNHPLMIIHPPMLYLGYVGMTLPFAIAMAALMRGRLDRHWLKSLRQWTLVPWACLFVGIILGSWWAYEVLGWGGYWAWDPVENASFLPWLAATGFLHATLVQERRGLLKAWTLALALASYLLVILGTFMTRSGVFNSVHSFTQSDIGPVFLVFLALLLLSSVALLAGRAHLFDPQAYSSNKQALHGTRPHWLSREAAFYLNNLVFVLLTFTVLLGTVFPLITEALQDTRVSVGEPYFNQMAVPLGIMMVFLMGVGPMLPWGQAKPSELRKRLWWPLAAGALGCGVAFALGSRGFLPLLSLALCGFAGWVTLGEMFAWDSFRKKNIHAVKLAFKQACTSGRRRTGGYMVHLAVVVIVAAITVSQTHKIQTEASLATGETFAIGNYSLTYRETRTESEPRRRSVIAVLDAHKNGERLGYMLPRLNTYTSQREPIGTPDVRSVWGIEDLYLSLMAYEPDGSRVAIKAFVLPLVPWIWASLPLIILGSLMAAWPRGKKRRKQSRKQPQAQAAGAHT